MDSKIYAHTLGREEENWEPLADHLANVATSASAFAGAFGASEWGTVIGRCHDLGKASEEFQRYLRLSSAPEAANAGVEGEKLGRVDHSTFGARYVGRKAGGLGGQLMAFCIAGHHTGLPDESSDDEAGQRGTLRYRLDDSNPIPQVREPEIGVTSPRLHLQRLDRAQMPFQLAFFTRMLFSCLIDADRTCTEEFCSPDTAHERSSEKPSLERLKSQLDAYLDSKCSKSPDTAVNRERRRVLQLCKAASSREPGFFSLNVPTGGGKTLSSLSFALDHSLVNGLRRVIFAIPFTSIVEQTADAYRDAFGSLADAVIEHHTNIRPEVATRANQLATENWDAPVVVTTNVQLFESLFAASTTPVRKLHQLARSIIVLDEAQAMPIHLLEPTLAALRELVRNYGCSVVLCTATQPALEKSRDFPIGIEGVRHIIVDPVPLFQALKRVEVKKAGKLSDEELASRLTEESSVLCIVNTRAHAARVFDRVVRECATDCFHLSTYMCGQHRREVLKRVRETAAQNSCRLISTQVVEAGVDLDFPVVYRAAAGFDSIAQAAGRCNREGKLPIGYTYVFDAEELPPHGLQRDGAQKAHELRDQFDDPISPEAIEEYFRQFNWSQKDRWDEKKIMRMMRLESNPVRAVLQFRQIETAYQVIQDRQLPILIPFDAKSEEFCSQLLGNRVDFIPQRQLQPYLVSMHEKTVREMESRSIVATHDSGIRVLLRKDAYSPTKGLDPKIIGLDPSLWGV